MSRRARSLVVVAVFITLAAGVLVAQGPRLPTLARLQALKLDVVTGDVPAYYSKGAARDVAASLGQRLDACRSLYSDAGRPPVVLAVLNATDWPQVTAAPYGMPHGGAEAPYVLVVPFTWQDAPAWLAGARDALAKALGPNGVDRYGRLLAVHELGHVITAAFLGQKNWQPIAARFPFWYGEFVVNYFAGGCNASRPDDAAFVRRGEAALAAMPRQKYTTLDDWDRLFADVDAAGRPYLTTEAGGLTFAAYQGLTGEMANRVHDAGFTAPRMIQLLRQQWARPGRQSTDDLVKDLTGAAPRLYEWLVQQGAIEASGKRSVPPSQDALGSLPSCQAYLSAVPVFF